MRLTRLGASKRAKQGWVTKRRNDPTRYGKIEKDKGRTYWKRPSGQKVRLEGFSHSDIQRLRPALVQTDVLLKKNVNPDVKKIQKFKPGLLNPKRHFLGGYTVPPGIGPVDFGKPKIILRDKEVRSPSAPGILAHEIGHSVFPGSRSPSQKKLNDYKHSFGYRGDTDMWKMQPTGNNPLKSHKGRTRQSVDSAEDFAETFRAETGLPIGRSHYFNDIYVNQSRQRFMKKHVIR